MQGHGCNTVSSPRFGQIDNAIASDIKDQWFLRLHAPIVQGGKTTVALTSPEKESVIVTVKFRSAA